MGTRGMGCCDDKLIFGMVPTNAPLYLWVESSREGGNTVRLAGRRRVGYK